MSEFKRYESDTAIGVTLEVELTNHETIEMALITQVDHNTPVPYFFENNYSDRNLITQEDCVDAHKALLEAVTESDSELIAPETKQWAKDVLETARRVQESVKDNHFEAFTFGATEDDIVTITPCLYQGTDEATATLADVEYYLVDDVSGAVGSDNSVYKVCVDMVNYEEAQHCLYQEKQDLQKFYEEKVMPIEELSYSQMTEEQQDTMGMFSDWHKDVYGHRPHSGNECAKQAHQSQKSSQRKDFAERE